MNASLREGRARTEMDDFHEDVVSGFSRTVVVRVKADTTSE